MVRINIKVIVIQELPVRNPIVIKFECKYFWKVCFAINEGVFELHLGMNVLEPSTNTVFAKDVANLNKYRSFPW